MEKDSATSVYRALPDYHRCSGLVFSGPHPAEQLIRVIDGEESPAALGVLAVERSPCGFHVSDVNSLPLCDIAQLFAGFLAVSARSRRALESTLQGFCDWIPLSVAEHPPGTYWLLHATCRLDALDYSASKVKRLSSGRIHRIESHVFDASKLEGVPIFRQQGERELFVTGHLRHLIEAAGLDGYLFERVL